MDEMSLGDKYIQRLIEWLESHGFTKEQILDCIEYLTK